MVLACGQMQVVSYPIQAPFIVGFGIVQDDKVYLHSVLQNNICFMWAYVRVC